MKRLLSMLSGLIIIASPVASVVSCSGQEDPETITIQVVSKKTNPNNAEDLSQIYDKVKDDTLNHFKKDANLSKYKIKFVDTDGDNFFIDKIKDGKVPFNDRSMPDVFRTQLDVKQVVDGGAFIPLDLDKDSLGQSGDDFLKSIGMVDDIKDSTAKVNGNGETYKFSKLAYDRAQLFKKGISEKHFFDIPTSIGASAGFFFNKSPDQLRNYQELGIGKIVNLKNQIVSDDEIKKIDESNVQNYTFDFGRGVTHGEKLKDENQSGYVSLNQLVVAAEKLYQKTANSGTKINLMSMGNFYGQASRFLEQISSKTNSLMKDAYVGDSWKQSSITENGGKYFDDIQQQSQVKITDPHAFSDIMKKSSDIKDKQWGTILSNSEFKDSAEKVIKQLFNFNAFETRFIRSTSWGSDEKSNTWREYWNAGTTSDDAIKDPTQMKLVKYQNNGKTENASDLYYLNNFGYHEAAKNMFGAGPSENPTPEQYESYFKNLDFANVWKFGIGNDKLSSTTNKDGVNDLTYDGDGSAQNNAAFSNLGGGGMAINSKIRSEKNYAEKLSVIRYFMKDFSDNYMADSTSHGVGQLYRQGDQMSTIDGAISKFVQKVNEGTEWTDLSKFPETRRMMLNELNSPSKLNDDAISENLLTEQNVNRTDQNLNNDSGKPFANSMLDLVKTGGTLSNYNDWNNMKIEANKAGIDWADYDKFIDTAVNEFMKNATAKYM